MNHKLLPVGFFKECFGGSGPSLKEAVRSTENAEEVKMASYLDHGKLFASIMGKARDVLSPDHEVAGCGERHILTDGIWAWPAFLSYYVMKYHIELPSELWEHARTNDWTVPAEIDMARLSLA